jgi:hypothetical protein
MRYIKLAIISFLAFFVLLYLMSALIPSTVRVSRAKNFNVQAGVLRPYLSDTARWKQWMTINTSEIDIQPVEASDSSAVSRWNYQGRDILSGFRIEESSGITVVQWYFDFHLKWYPWEKFGSITFDKQFGPAMEQSLGNLQTLVEKTP